MTVKAVLDDIDDNNAIFGCLTYQDYTFDVIFIILMYISYLYLYIIFYYYMTNKRIYDFI